MTLIPAASKSLTSSLKAKPNCKAWVFCEASTLGKDHLKIVTGPVNIPFIGLVVIETATPWNEGLVKFEGVPLTQLLKAANADGDTATVIALNDYSVDVPTADFSEFGTILAVKRNGEYMPVDDQGPFFVIYPFDSNPILQAQPYYGRAVWQVKEISVE